MTEPKELTLNVLENPKDENNWNVFIENYTKECRESDGKIETLNKIAEKYGFTVIKYGTYTADEWDKLNAKWISPEYLDRLRVLKDVPKDV